MFFKRIEMVGFKSFATKTVFDFIPGTTVVVGPNGCGKSNVLDSIKWVLGEQAASQMRGKKMQDVIFAGSASFKPMNVAQVTLTIDNTRRLLPVDYNEVQITRRLFRSGDSEYLLNKQPSRLRDIHNLFLGTGIGKSAYSMLEQGRVDQIINAKPQERRFIIEEAAGISKYKVRRLEAQRKLERTGSDLSNLNNLIFEIDRKVSSLKRQAQKAERYRNLYEAHRQAEQELLVLRSSGLTAKLEQLQHDFGGILDALAAQQAALAQKSAEYEEARDQEEELSEMLSDEGQALFDLKNNLTEIEGQITRLNTSIGHHATRREQIEEELKQLGVQSDEMSLRIEENELRMQEASERRTQRQEEFAQFQLRYEDLQSSGRERTRLIDELTTQVNNLREALSRAENEARTAQVLIERNNQSATEARSAIDALEESHIEQALLFEELKEKLEGVSVTLENTKNELFEKRQGQAERQKRLGECLREMDQTSKTLHQSASRLDTLNELKASYEGYYQGVREVMLAADHHQLHGVQGVLANLVHAKEELEVAVEVAMATHIQDIVVSTADNGKAAIEYLKHSGRGRATFLPLDRLQVTPLAPQLRQILGRPGVLGVASELVEYDRYIKNAVDFTLGSTIVVRDLDVALELGRQGFRARYVSLDGQLINPGGAMTGGRVKATGLMTREREIRDLEQTVQQMEQRGRQLRDEIEKIQLEQSTVHSQIEALQASFDQQRLEEAGLRKDVESAERGSQDAERILAERKAQIERIEQEIASHKTSIDEATALAEQKRQELALAEEQMEGQRRSAREQGDDIMTVGTSMAEARKDMERATEQIAESQQMRQSLAQDMEAIERTRSLRLKETEELIEEDRKLNEQIDRIKQEAESIYKEREEMTQRLGANQTIRQELQEKVKRLEQEIEVLSRDTHSQENKHHELDLQRTELTTKLSELSEQCLEKFEMELAELTEKIGAVEKDQQALHVEVTDLKDKLGRIGPINMAALEEYKEEKARLDFLQEQHKDLSEAKKQLEDTIDKLDQTTRKLFHETFEQVRENFVNMFRRLFNGGKADLILDAPEGTDPLLDGGIEIIAQPPGKKLQSITLMSGGEKAMSAISLLFGLFLYKPSPFCIMDEIDAPLDDLNVERFKNVVNEFKADTQFLVITHNKITMELADAIYGVTMEESGVSKLVSVRFEQAAEMVDVG